MALRLLDSAMVSIVTSLWAKGQPNIWAGAHGDQAPAMRDRASAGSTTRS